MLDLELTDEQQAVAELARELGSSLLAPAAREAESAGAVPAAVASAVHATGLTAPVPERLGGGGIPDAVTYVLAVEGLAYGDPGLAMATVWAGAPAMFIALCGTTTQQDAYLPAFADGPSNRGAVAVYEGFGRAPSELATTVEVDGPVWRVRGTKVGVAAAAAANPLLMVGRDPTAGRLRAALFGPATDGVVVREVPRNLGLDAACLGSVTIDARVGADQILGGVDGDPLCLEHAIARLRLCVAAAALGTARRAVDYASNYATERVAFGRPIAAFQGVSFMLAEALTKIEAARLDMLDGAAQIDRGTVAEDGVTWAVNYATAAATHATRDAVQVLGGHGFITDHPVELWYRSAAALAALDFDPTCSSFEPAL